MYYNIFLCDLQNSRPARRNSVHYSCEYRPSQETEMKNIFFEEIWHINNVMISIPSLKSIKISFQSKAIPVPAGFFLSTLLLDTKPLILNAGRRLTELMPTASHPTLTCDISKKKSLHSRCLSWTSATCPDTICCFHFADLWDSANEVFWDPSAPACTSDASGAHHHQPCDQVTSWTCAAWGPLGRSSLGDWKLCFYGPVKSFIITLITCRYCVHLLPNVNRLYCFIVWTLMTKRRLLAMTLTWRWMTHWRPRWTPSCSQQPVSRKLQDWTIRYRPRLNRHQLFFFSSFLSRRVWDSCIPPLCNYFSCFLQCFWACLWEFDPFNPNCRPTCTPTNVTQREAVYVFGSKVILRTLHLNVMWMVRFCIEPPCLFLSLPRAISHISALQKCCLWITDC